MLQSQILSTPNVENVFMLSFTAVDDKGLEVELVPGGAGKSVTDSNKMEYVNLLIQHKLTKEHDRPVQVSFISSVELFLSYVLFCRG